jgi:hypothetical protein
MSVEELRLWIRIVVVIATVATTSVPIVYAFTPWYTRPIGRLFMLQAVSFTIAMSLRLLTLFWIPKNPLVIFWIAAVTLTLIAGSTTALAILIWRMNHPKKKGGRNAQAE